MILHTTIPNDPSPSGRGCWQAGEGSIEARDPCLSKDFRVTLRSNPHPNLSPSGRGAKFGCVLIALMLVLMVMSSAATAQAIDPLPFRDHAEELRFQHLTSELRCLVCQDENLADSNADFARDLRHKVFELMQEGKTDAEIKQYLVDRYSDFVLYDPPVNAHTWLLWLGPLLILIAGGFVVGYTIRKRSHAGTPSAPTDNGDDW
jgi:cytochrome c-type biogenesis protein CcmH